MIKRLVIFDFDGTLIDSPMPETGKVEWSEKKGKPYPYLGWWGRPESLDLDVFDIKPFPSVLAELQKEINAPNTYVVILTSRMEKLRLQVQSVLNINHIQVDKLDMKRAEGNKGVKLLRYVSALPDLQEISVYEDRDTDIEAYEGIRNQIPEGVTFNIYLADNGKLSLLETENKLVDIIKEEIQNFVAEDDYVYHGTYDGAGFSMQRDGRMRINGAGNNEPFISFTSKPNVAKYYADMKGGSGRGIVLRTPKTNDFQLSPKFNKNNGFEWITTKEIPTDKLEINTQYGWIPLYNWDFIDKEIKK